MATAGTLTVTVRVRDEATPLLRDLAVYAAQVAEVRNARRVHGWNRYQMVAAR